MQEIVLKESHTMHSSLEGVSFTCSHLHMCTVSCRLTEGEDQNSRL